MARSRLQLVCPITSKRATADWPEGSDGVPELSSGDGAPHPYGWGTLTIRIYRSASEFAAPLIADLEASADEADKQSDPSGPQMRALAETLKGVDGRKIAVEYEFEPVSEEVIAELRQMLANMGVVLAEPTKDAVMAALAGAEGDDE